MSLIVLYFLHSTSVFSFYIDVVLTLYIYILLLLAICAGNSSATDEFPSQRPVTRSFGVFFDLHLNSWINNDEAGDLRRHRAYYYVTLMTFTIEIYRQLIKALLVRCITKDHGKYQLVMKVGMHVDTFGNSFGMLLLLINRKWCNKHSCFESPSS